MALVRLPKLRKLVLWKDQRVDDAALPYLNAMVSLGYLDVAETHSSPAARQQLRPAHVR